MPICNHCASMQASAEMRRSPKGGWLCKDKTACINRQARQDVAITTERRAHAHQHRR